MIQFYHKVLELLHCKSSLKINAFNQRNWFSTHKIPFDFAQRKVIEEQSLVKLLCRKNILCVLITHFSTTCLQCKFLWSKPSFQTFQSKCLSNEYKITFLRFFVALIHLHAGFTCVIWFERAKVFVKLYEFYCKTWD